MSRLRHGMARVEFLAVRSEVEPLLAQGYTYALIYEKLKSEGKISMCYGAFRTYLHSGQAKPRASPRHAPRERKAESAPAPAEHCAAPSAVPPEESGPRRVSAATVAKDFRKPARSVSELLFGNTE